MTTRIRTIKPEWLEDEQLAEAGTLARLLSVGLIVLSDDHGRGRANEVVLAAKVFTYEPDPVRCLREALASLSRIGFVQLYEVRGQRYYQIRNWAKHQRVDRPSKPRFPGPDEADGTPKPPAPTPPDKTDSANHSRGLPVPLAPDRDLDQGSGSGSGSGPRAGSRARAPARDEAQSPSHVLDEQALHDGWRKRWDALNRGEPSGGTGSMAKSPFAPEWRELLVKVEAHALALGAPAHVVAGAVLDALFATSDAFVSKERNPRLLVSQFAKWADDAAKAGKLRHPQRSRLLELDAAIIAAMGRGDREAEDRLKAERAEFCAASQRKARP